MDIGMSFVQKEAWDKIKKAVNDYSSITGSEIAVVTTYLSAESPLAVDNAPVTSMPSLAIHGHGDLLRRVRESFGRPENLSKSLNSTSHSLSNGWASSPSAGIPIKAPSGHGEATHYNQAVARSLCSSFRSLKLDQRGNSGFINPPTSMIGQSGGPQPANSSSFHSNRRGNKRNSRKKVPAVGSNGDSLELDENLLFDEPSYGTSGDENEEDDEFGDSDDDSTDVSENSFGRHSHFPPMRTFQRPPPVVQPSVDQFATSLPVNINIQWGGQRAEVGPHFRDNQGPHPPIVRSTQPAPQYSSQSSRSGPRGSQDTPNPETMMASIQALARSVTDDSALIFGERPRPRLNTGEFRMTRARR